jgi:molybdate transport system substrate-binding protein
MIAIESRAICVCCLLGFSLLGTPKISADTITVAVASNFAETLEAISTKFEQQFPHDVVLVRGSSGRHFAQIVNGAPFDVFLSADTRRPQALVDAEVVENSKVKPYAIGRLALWSSIPTANKLPRERLVEGDFNHLAIANPRLAPYGKAAMEVLENIGLASLIQSSSENTLVYGENVAQAFQFVSTDNAELGFVALSQVINSVPDEEYWQVPADLHAPIVQSLAQLTDTEAVKQFLNFLTGSEGSLLLRQQGYLLPTQN